jgi:hypothetical protein
MKLDYTYDNNYNNYECEIDNDNERCVGIPIYTSNTFYSDFICQNTNYINIDNIKNFNKIIKNNNKYYINTFNGELYVGNDFNKLVKLNINRVFIFDISTDGNYLVYAIDNEVNMYNLRTNKNEVIKQIGFNMYDDINNKYIKDIMFTPDNSRLIYCQNEHIYIWNINENKLYDKIETNVVNFTADNNYILISNYDKFSIYHINNKKNIFNNTFENNIIKKIKTVNNKIIIGFINGSIVIMSIYSCCDPNSYIYFQNNYEGIKDIAISKNNNYMACVDGNDVLSVFDINTNQHIYSLNGFRVSSIIINNNLDIIGTGHFNSISHFVMPDNN